MAFIRILTSRSNLLKQNKHHLSLSYILHENTHDKNTQEEQFNRSFSTFNITNPSFQDSRKHNVLSSYHLSPSIGSSFCRYMSTTIGEESGSIELMTDVADVLTASDAAVSSLPAVNEVAVAAADSYLPVAALQYLIDTVHSFTGLNWWASIALTTLLVRCAIIPLTVHQLKSTAKLSLVRPKLEQINAEIQATGMDPVALAEGQKRIKLLFKEHGVSPFSPMMGLFIQGPIFLSFFWGILNMAEKVPSFKTGGAFWFVDLSTPDSLYIFPVLSALTFWIIVEFNMQEGLEGNPVASKMKMMGRVFAALALPLTMSFPKAVFCYWITSNAFSFAYGSMIKRPEVKKFLGIPEIPADAPGSTPSSMSFSTLLKQAVGSRPDPAASSSPVQSQSKASNHRISSSSVLSQKIKSLEKQVKGRKKNKKR